jgi:hypothetical protein
MTVDHRGRLHVFNGTFQAYLSTWDPLTDSWTTYIDSPVSVSNNVAYGKPAAFGDYVFLTDHEAGGSLASGITRIDTTDGSYVRFATPSHYNDVPIALDIGPDGLLYSLGGAGSPSGRFIEVYDPLTLNLVRTISLAHIAWGQQGGTGNDVVVQQDGTLLYCQLYSPVFKLNPLGALLSTHPVSQTTYIDDFDEDGDGTKINVNFDGRVYVYDDGFNVLGQFETTNYYASGSFGCFVPPLGTRLVPRGFTAFRGVVTAGDQYALWSSDDSKLTVKAGLVLFPSESPVQVIVNNFSPLKSPSEIRFKLEATVNTPNLQQVIEMFNVQNNQWEELDVSPGSATDSIVEVTVSFNAARFVNQQTNEMRARVRYYRSGLTLVWPWSASIDQCLWTVMP